MTLAERNNSALLSALERRDGLTEGDWRKESGISYGSFAGAKKRLLADGSVISVVEDGTTYYYLGREDFSPSVGKDLGKVIEKVKIDIASSAAKEKAKKGSSSVAQNSDLLSVKSSSRVLFGTVPKSKGTASKAQKITGFFNDFDEWQINVEDAFGDVSFDDNGCGRCVVILEEFGGARQVYRYREDDDGNGLFFR